MVGEVGRLAGAVAGNARRAADAVDDDRGCLRWAERRVWERLRHRALWIGVVAERESIGSAPGVRSRCLRELEVREGRGGGNGQAVRGLVVGELGWNDDH